MEVGQVGPAYTNQILPDVANPYLKTGELVRCLPDWCSGGRYVMLAYRFGAEKIVRINAVLIMAQEYIPTMINP